MRNIAYWLAFAGLALTAVLVAGANLPPSPIVQVWGGGRHTIALLSDGSVWTWGSDFAGKLGNNQVSPSYNVTNNDSFVPICVHGPGNVGYLNSIVAISAGESHNMALRSDGTVWTWGWNYYGQLGNGTTNDAHTPIQVTAVSNVVAISGRAYHCLALESDGTVWSWGQNDWGQLGNGSSDANAHPFPAQVIGITNPAAISAAYASSLVLMSNGTVQMWGTSETGELGQGVFNDHAYSPIPVPGISNVVSISAGFQEPQALKSDGTIWMWGYGNCGQLGDDATNNTCEPAPAIGLTNMLAPGPTGDRTSSALRADHTVWTWGRNWNGQLGIGTANSNLCLVPARIPAFGSAPVTMVQTPDWHSLAIESDGTLWEWGSNDHGQLGSGTTNEAWSPQLVSTWPAAAPPMPVNIACSGVRKLAGSFQFGFTNTPGSQFTVVSATNMQTPFAHWTPVGGVTEVSPGHFQFNDPAAGSALRFYGVRSP